MALHTHHQEGGGDQALAIVHCSWLCQMDRRRAICCEILRTSGTGTANQRLVMTNQRTVVWPYHLSWSWYSSYLGEIQWKVSIKDAKHFTIRCLYLPFLCAGWLMYPDIRYLLFLFHSFPEFVPKMYLWRDDGKWKKWKMINLWKKWNIIELSWRVQMSETVIFLIQNSFKRYLSF